MFSKFIIVAGCLGVMACGSEAVADCTVNVAGAATATVDCVNEAEGAVCTVN